MKGSTRLALILLAAGPSGRLAAQGVLNQFSYDNLRLSGIQLDAGLLGASDLAGATVGIVGAGGIGRETIARLGPFGVRILGLTRSGRALKAPTARSGRTGSTSCSARARTPS